MGLNIQKDFPESDLSDTNTAVISYTVAKGMPEVEAGADFVADNLHGLSYTARYALTGLGLEQPPSVALGEYDAFCRGYSIYGIARCLVSDGRVDEEAMLRGVANTLVLPGAMADFEMMEDYKRWRDTFPNLRQVVRSDSRSGEPTATRAMREMGAMVAHRLRLPPV